MPVQQHLKFGLYGEWRDTYVYADGRVEHGVWRKNQIQNGATFVAAGLFARVGEVAPWNGPPIFTGISYIAVGSGEVGWDSVAPDKDKAQTTLTAEYFRKVIPAADMAFLDYDDPDHPPVVGPSRMIQITSSFAPDEANGAMREFGLFGGNATGVADSGLIINWVDHSVINKDATLTLNRTIRITFLNP